MSKVVTCALLCLIALFFNIGCTPESHSATSMPSASDSSMLALGETVTTEHQLGQSIVVGTTDKRHNVAPIRFTILDVTFEESRIKVNIRAESAEYGRIAYFDASFAVANYQGVIITDLAASLSDNFQNEYTVEPILPKELRGRGKETILYPGKQLEFTIPFKGPVVPMADSVTFKINYRSGNGYEKHEWTVARPVDE